MGKIQRIIVVIVCVNGIAMAGCSGSSGGGSASPSSTSAISTPEGTRDYSQEPGSEQSQAADFLAAQGMVIEDTVTEQTSGYVGYRARYNKLNKTPWIPIVVGCYLNTLQRCPLYSIHGKANSYHQMQYDDQIIFRKIS